MEHDLDLDDDDALAVYGDVLAQTDEARAELIAVQRALARRGIEQVDDLIEASTDASGEATDARSDARRGIEKIDDLIEASADSGEATRSDADLAASAALLRRQHVLLAQHRGRWVRALGAGERRGTIREVEFRRGLPVSLAYEPPDAIAAVRDGLDEAPEARAAARMFASAPATVRAFALDAARVYDIESLAVAPGLARLRTLAIAITNAPLDLGDPAMTAARAELVVALDGWRQRQRDAGSLDVLAELMQSIAAAAPDLVEVRWFGHALDPRALDGLAHLRAFAGTIVDRGLRRAATTFARVERLELVRGPDGIDDGALDEPLRVFDGRFAAVCAMGLHGFDLEAPPTFALVLPAKLSLGFDLGSTAAVAAIVASPAMARVEELALAGSFDSDRTILEALAANPHLDRLAHVRVECLPNSGELATMRAPALVSLVLDETELQTDELVALLVAHPKLRVLEVKGLVGVNGDVGDVGGRIAPHVGRLRSLGLASAGLTDAGLAAIAANAPALRRLRIGGNPIGAMPAMPSLVSLHVGHVPFAGARADDLVELGVAPLADQNARIRLRARFGEGAPGTAPRPPTAHGLVAVIDGPGSDALFAELRAAAGTIVDDDTVLDAMGLRVVGRAPGLLKLFHDPARRAEAIALAHRAGGTLYFEDADDG